MTSSSAFSKTISDTKAHLDCRQIAENVLGRPVSRGTKWWLFHAPGRADRHPSFGVQADRYTDFATDENGNLFDLLMLLYNLTTFKEAYAVALELAGGSALPSCQPRPQIVHPERNTPPSPAWQQAAQDAVTTAEKYLWSDRPDAAAARQYLLHERGLTEATLRRFRLGFNPRWTKTTCRKPDTGNTVEYANLAPGIVIPCFVEGSLWYVKVRCIVGTLATALHQKPAQLGNTESPKYLNLVGGIQGALFNAKALSEGKPALVVEGEFDAMLADQLCHEQVAAVTVGSAANTLLPHFQQQLEQAPLILLSLDNDQAGQAGASRLQTRLQGRVYPVSLPTGKDISEYVVSQQGNLPAFVTEALATARSLPSVVSKHSQLGLPDTLRAALNRYCYAAIAPTWELWHEAIQAGLLTPSEAITIKRLWTMGQLLGRDTSIDTLKAGLKAGAGLFWGVLQTGISSKKEEGKIDILSSICKTPQNTTGGGRKAVEYILFSPQRQRANLLVLAASRILEKHFPAREPTIAPVRAEFLMALQYESDQAVPLSQVFSKQYGDLISHQPELPARLDRARMDYQRLAHDLAITTSSPLPTGWLYRNAAEYVAAFCRAVIEAAPNQQRSRKQLARLVGRSERNMDAVLSLAGTTNQPQVVEQPITSPEAFDRVERSYNSEMKGYPVKVVSVRGAYTAVRGFTPDQRAFVEKELAAGGTVSIVYQQASLQVIVTEGQPSSHPKPRGGILGRPSRLKKERRANQKYYGPGFDPAWVLAGLLKLLEAGTTWRVRGKQVRDQVTGQLLPLEADVVVGILLAPEANLSADEYAALPRKVAADPALQEYYSSSRQVRNVTDEG